MNTGMNTANWMGIISNIISAIAFIIILLGFKGKQLPIYNEKLYFYILFILGFAMSILAGFRDFPDGHFKLPQIMLWTLMLLGFMAFALVVSLLFKLKLPIGLNYSTAFTLLSIIIVSKWILTRSYLLFKFFTNTMG